MHRKPGAIVPTKIGTQLSWHSTTLMRTLLAAVFFSLLTQGLHLSAEPSALHFVGALPIYLLLGFIPALFGFGLSLLLQGGLSASTDLSHLAVNSWFLLLPLIAVHFTLVRKLGTMTNGHHIRWQSILELEAMYYGGVTGLVGLWLLITAATMPFAAWGMFATACFAIAALESAFIYSLLRLRKFHQRAGWAHFISPLRRAQLRSSSL